MEELSAIKFKECVNVCLYLLIVPGDDGAEREVLQASLGRLSSHLRIQICLLPVLVHEENGLSRALLSRMAVGIMVTLPGHVVDLCLRPWHIWAEYLPVVATILELNLSVEGFGKVLTDPR